MIVAALVMAIGVHHLRAASEHVGQVAFAGTPVPGAMVTASLGDKQIITFTNQDGLYRLADLADGTWTIKIDMRGFAPMTKEIIIGSGAQPEGTVWELMLLPFEEITRGLPPPRPAAPATPAATAGTTQAQGSNGSSRGSSGGRNAAAAPAAPAQQGFQRAGVNAAQRPPAAAAAPAPEPPADAAAANDGFLINGSVNNGAASPFAQLAAFGNNRRRPGALYNAQLAMIGGTSAWDAKPFSLTGQAANVP